MDLCNALNFIRFPGFVRPCYYEAGICKASISVRTGVLFTIVTVNGLDIYFTRLTGKVDGVGFSPTSDCKLDEVPKSVHLGD